MKKVVEINISKKLNKFANILLYNFHKDTNELYYIHNNTQKKCIEIICDIMQECYNKNIKNKKKDTPLLIPLSPNKYTSDTDWKYLRKKRYQRDSVKLTFKCLVHFNIITIEYGGIILEYNELSNVWMKLDSILTRVWLKPISEWKPIFNILKNENYKQLDLHYMFYPDKDVYEKPALCRKQIYDNITGKPKKHNNGKKVKYPIPVHKSYYDDLYEINKALIDNGYQNLQYHRVFGDTPDEYGRIYSPIQSLSKIERKAICNEMGWTEIDFKSFIPSILYEISTGKKCNEDQYLKITNHLGLPIEYRPMYKSILIFMTCCNEKKISRKAIINVLSGMGGTGCYSDLTDSICTIEDLKDKLDEKSYLENIEILKHNKKNPNDKKNFKNYYELKKYQFKQYLLENNFDLNTPHYIFNVDYIMNEIEKLFPYFKPFLYNSTSKITQNIESDITLELSKIMISFNILPLSIHDSFIIPKKYEKYFNNIKDKIKFYYASKYRLNNNNKNKIINKYVNSFNIYNNNSIIYTVMNWNNKYDKKIEVQKKPP